MFRDGPRQPLRAVRPGSRALAIGLVIILSGVVGGVTFLVTRAVTPELTVYTAPSTASNEAAAGPAPTETLNLGVSPWKPGAADPDGSGADDPEVPTGNPDGNPGSNPGTDAGSLAGGQLWAASPLSRIHQDQGTSVQLPDGRTLWIFADTFQRHSATHPKEPDFFVTSAAAVSEPGSLKLRYAVGDDGRPAEFLPRSPVEFDDHVSGKYYEAVWPTGATIVPGGRIIVSYAKYRVLPTAGHFEFLGAGLFSYQYTGVAALLHGAQADRIASDIWGVADGEIRSPVYSGGYVYFSQCQNLHCYSLRTTPAGLVNRGTYRWWSGNGWTANPLFRQAIVVGSGHPGGNASVVKLRSGLYAMADTEAGAVSTTGLLWVARNPWGPWSTAAAFPFARCPEPGCYGLNLHPAQSTSTSLRVGYATGYAGPYVRLDDVPVKISSDATIQVR